MRLRLRRLPIPPSIVLPRRWRRHWVSGIVVFILAAVVAYERSRDGAGGCIPAEGGGRGSSIDASDRARYHNRSFDIVDVVDGDTLKIDIADGARPATTIRLWGVDSPEVHPGSKPPMYFGPEASAFAERTLAGRSVHIVLDPAQTRDKYHRLLAFVFLEPGGRMFNEMLLEEGLAYADPRFDHAYERRFEATEKRARAASAGLWARVGATDMPLWRQRLEGNRKMPKPLVP